MSAGNTTCPHLTWKQNTLTLHEDSYKNNTLPYNNNTQQYNIITAEVSVIISVMLIGTIANALMLYAVYRTPHLRTVQNVFTINQGMADLLICLVILPLWVIVIFTPALDNSIFLHLCRMTAFFTVVLMMVSLSTLALISLDRHFSICYAFQYPSEITSTRVNLVVAYIWIQSSVVGCLPLFGWGEYSPRPLQVPICFVHWTHTKAFSIFMFIIGLLLPFLTVLFSYTRIMQVNVTS